MDQENNHIPSEGEEFLKSFFDEIGIKCKNEVKISGLKNDHKQYRVADFYLTDYKVYVEFFGLWNTDRSDEYRKKKIIYEQNGIPCVYIFPENLGIIKFLFDKRLLAELQKHNLKKELFRYRFFKFKKSSEFKWTLTGIIIILIGIPYKLSTVSHLLVGDYILLPLFFIFLIYLCLNFYQLYSDFFKKNRYTLDKID